MPTVMASEAEADHLVSSRELSVEFITIAVFECGKGRPLESILHIIDILESRFGQIFRSRSTACAIAGNDEKVIRFFEQFCNLFHKTLILFAKIIAALVALCDECVGIEQVGKEICPDRMAHKLVFGPRSHIQEIGIGHGIEHVLGLDTQYFLHTFRFGLTRYRKNAHEQEEKKGQEWYAAFQKTAHIR